MRVWFNIAGTGAVIGLMLLISAKVPWHAGRSGPLIVAAQQEAGAEDQSLLEELAGRLLSQPSMPLMGGQGPIHLLPGAEPADIPLDVPPPPGGRLLGSIVRDNGPQGGGPAAQVVMDAPGRPRDVLEYVESSLADLGWARPAYAGDTDALLHGFEQPQASLTRTLCQSDQGPGLSLTVRPTEDGVNDVRLSYSTVYPCTMPGFPGGLALPVATPIPNPIPLLQAPDGVQLQVGATGPYGGAGATYASAATATTDQSPMALEAAFAAQLSASGWQRIGGGGQGPFAWSTWRVAGGDELLGVLTVVQMPAGNEQALSIQVYSRSVPGSSAPGARPYPSSTYLFSYPYSPAYAPMASPVPLR